MYVYTYVNKYKHIYIYIHMYIHTYTHVYIYIYNLREDWAAPKTSTPLGGTTWLMLPV